MLSLLGRRRRHIFSCSELNCWRSLSIVELLRLVKDLENLLVLGDGFGLREGITISLGSKSLDSLSGDM